MARAPDARTVVTPLVGTTIKTVTGQPNVVLNMENEAVLVGSLQFLTARRQRSRALDRGRRRSSAR
jgi:hypothetical protein